MLRWHIAIVWPGLKVMFIGASVLIVRWSSLSSLKNVVVAWRLIDVMKEWQKLKIMTSMLGGVYMITARLSFRAEMKSCTVFTLSRVCWGASHTPFT